MKESLKTVIGIFVIFILGVVAGYFLQPQPNHGKIDQLNKDIAGNLIEIDRLNGELTGLYKENTTLLIIQEKINEQNKNLLKELKNASLSRKQKLVLLNDYLLFIDKSIQQFQNPSSPGSGE